MQPSNPKQSFTQDCAFLALTKLIRNKPLSSISVTELTKKAGISRTAFYNNYNSVEDVIAKYFDKCVDNILDSSDCIRGHSLSKKSSNGWAFLRLYDKMVLGDERCWNAEKWIVVS